MGQNKISGVYKITNNITGDFYIGSSKDIKLRWANHRSPSKWKLRPGMKLYQAFIKYGLGNFIFEVLEETADLKECEQYWIEKLKPSYNNSWAKGWNTKRHKETSRRCCKEYYEIHRNEQLAKAKAYRQAHRYECLARTKDCNSRLCLYEGETLTLSALSKRFCRQGIPHSYIEAKKYLIERSL